jgi:hypothetical protein
MNLRKKSMGKRIVQGTIVEPVARRQQMMAGRNKKDGVFYAFNLL